MRFFSSLAQAPKSIFHTTIYIAIVVLTLLRFWLLLSAMLVLLFSFSFNETLFILLRK